MRTPAEASNHTRITTIGPKETATESSSRNFLDVRSPQNPRSSDARACIWNLFSDGMNVYIQLIAVRRDEYSRF